MKTTACIIALSASALAAQQLALTSTKPPKVEFSDNVMTLTSEMGPLHKDGPLFTGNLGAGHTVVDYKIGNSRTLRILCKIDRNDPTVASCANGKLAKALREHKPVQIRYRARIESPYFEVAR
jgi:hypothetical protein